MTPEGSPLGPYTLWAVFRRPAVDRQVRPGAGPTLQEAVTAVEAAGAHVRGIYDVSGLRSDADLMFWLHGASAELLQSSLRTLRRSALIADLEPAWSAMGVHRDAEFNKQHVPGFMRGIAAKRWMTIYPFVRSYEWYLLPAEERGALLAEHGRAGAAFTGVTANTVSSFALGDWEWLLPLEAEELTDLVDVMRELRATGARRHVREEVPFYTGRRIGVDEVPEVLS